MITDILFLILGAGIPYFLLLEKVEKLQSKHIFLISWGSLLAASVMFVFVPHQNPTVLTWVALVSALFSIYKATKTTNFYKLGYYLIFINAPFFLLFEESGALHSFSLLVTLFGLYLIARFYEKHYGSANYYHVRGVTLITPCVGTYLTLYLIALALYPPFPNSLFFMSGIFKVDPNLLWYLVVIVIFFGNFFLSMKVVTSTLFGRKNPNIHYVHMTLMDKVVHTLIFVVLLGLSIVGLKEILV